MKPDIDISQLSPAECILLAEQLWERVRNHPEALPVTEAQMTELSRRLLPGTTWRRPFAGTSVSNQGWKVISDCAFAPPYSASPAIPNPVRLSAGKCDGLSLIASLLRCSISRTPLACGSLVYCIPAVIPAAGKRGTTEL
jgi:hypothetical protein